jgi:hypothetical protein
MDQQQAKFEGWAVVGLFGHQKEAGFVTTEYYGNAAMFRIDVPELPEREWVLERPQRGDNYELLPIGTKVKREAVAARSRLVGPGAVYDMTPCTEELVRRAIEQGLSRPLIVLEMPAKPQLTAGPDGEEDEEDYTGSDNLEEELPI